MDNNNLKKISRQGALISLIGCVVVLFVFGFGSKELIDVRTKLEVAIKDLFQAQNSLAEMKEAYLNLESSIEKDYPPSEDDSVITIIDSIKTDTTYIDSLKRIATNVVEHRTNDSLIPLKNDTITDLKLLIASSKTDTTYIDSLIRVPLNVVEFRPNDSLVELKNDTILDLKLVIASFKTDTATHKDTVFVYLQERENCLFGSWLKR
jgi:hypothetical protein